MKKDYVNIGSVKLKKTAALAPMASVADRAYRLMCKHFGAVLVTSEMVSVKGIYYNLKKSKKLFEITEQERPMAIQLFGDDPKYFELALYEVLKCEPDIIDINMGCPVNKVVKDGSGCALMKNMKLAEKIALSVVKNSPVPVTVKLRKGWDENSVNVCEFAKMLEQSGVSAITVHGRTRQQMFSKKVDMDIIKEVKKSVSIPVIANGDIFTPEDCKYMYDYTNADLVMIARGSFGRPYIFKQISDYFSTGKFKKNFDIHEIVDIMLMHMKKIFEFDDEKTAARKARAQAMRYFKGIKNAANIRKICCHLNCYSDVLSLADFVKNMH